MAEHERRRLGRPPLDEMAEGERRAHILAVAAQLFGQRGYASVSLGDIALDVGVTKAALYHHFHSKDDLYAEVVSSMLEAIAAAIYQVSQLPLTMREKLTLLTRVAVVEVQSDAELDAMLRDVSEHLGTVQRTRVAAAHQTMNEAYQTLMRSGIARGELRDMDPQLLAHAYHHLLAGFAGRAGTEAGYQGRAETVTALVDLFLRGAGTAALYGQSPSAGSGQVQN